MRAAAALRAAVWSPLMPPLRGGSGAWLEASGSGHTPGMLTSCSTSLMPAEAAADGSVVSFGTPMSASGCGALGSGGGGAPVPAGGDLSADAASTSSAATSPPGCEFDPLGSMPKATGLGSMPMATGRPSTAMPRALKGAEPVRLLTAQFGIGY